MDCLWGAVPLWRGLHQSEPTSVARASAAHLLRQYAALHLRWRRSSTRNQSAVAAGCSAAVSVGALRHCRRGGARDGACTGSNSGRAKEREGCWRPGSTPEEPTCVSVTKICARNMVASHARSALREDCQWLPGGGPVDCQCGGRGCGTADAAATAAAAKGAAARSALATGAVRASMAA